MTSPDPDRITWPSPQDHPRSPVRCVVGDTLCEVRVLSEAEWDALPPNRRPSTSEHVPGLGWVVATPGRLK